MKKKLACLKDIGLNLVLRIDSRLLGYLALSLLILFLSVWGILK
ncbi:hypothetical protein LCGC14_0969870 [marine sediment metagenome]|uniref:Uncharacterized protein n=1 Tax=marine sediment metagenome TaxID=412755 RepID=A0A0F9RIC7_9ZZZZ